MSVGVGLTIRRWERRDGDRARPDEVLGVPVERVLLEQEGRNGALLALQGHRYALSGPIAAMGRSAALAEYVRGRARDAGTASDRAWYRAVARRLGALQPDRRLRAGRRGPSPSQTSTLPRS